jgi:hypothetical protein
VAVVELTKPKPIVENIENQNVVKEINQA